VRTIKYSTSGIPIQRYRVSLRAIRRGALLVADHVGNTVWRVPAQWGLQPGFEARLHQLQL